MTEEKPDGYGNIVKTSKDWVRTPNNLYSTSDMISTFNGHVSDESHYNAAKHIKYRNNLRKKWLNLIYFVGIILYFY